MKDAALFFQRFLKRKGKVGSVVPSSTFLAKKMAHMVQFGKVKTVVELGGGTGAVTEAILRQKPKEANLVIFEPDEEFFGILRKKFKSEKKVSVVKEGAENMRDVLSRLKLPEPDCVVSSIPFASLGKRISGKILAHIRESLSEKGTFVLYQYTPLMFPLILKYFKIRKMAVVPLNVPPAFVLCCSPRREK